MSPIGPVIPSDARHKASICPCCNRHAARLHRIRLTPGTGWKAGCAICVAAALEHHEHATYGGSIPGHAAARRRRRKEARQSPRQSSGQSARLTAAQDAQALPSKPTPQPRPQVLHAPAAPAA